MRIGELSRRAGVSVRSLRYYEEQGLLESVRSASGQRHYTEVEVERVTFIQQLYAAGLSSRTIAELLPCVDAPSEANSAASLQRMREERVLLGQRIEDLLATQAKLDAMIVCSADHLDSWREARSA